MTKADPIAGIPQESRVKEIRETDMLTEPVTLDLDGTRPIPFIPDANEVIPHASIPIGVKNAIIADYGEEFFDKKQWTRGQVTRLHRALKKPRENLTNTLALICSKNCPFKLECSYDIIGKTPIGERCPREQMISEELYKGYLADFSQRLGLSEAELTSSYILHNLITGIVECDVVKARAVSMLAHDGIVIDVVAAVNEQSGEVFERKEESPLIRIIERYDNRKDKLFRQLLATPEMQEKFRNNKQTVDIHAKTMETIASFEKTLAKITGTGIKDAEIIEDKSEPKAAPVDFSIPVEPAGSEPE